MKTIKHLYMLLAVILLATLPAMAQNTNDDKNKAIIETNDGSQELNTDDISVIRFNGGKVTVVQPSGETTFDRTLRSLSFQRPNPGTLRLTATTSIGTSATSTANVSPCGGYAAHSNNAATTAHAPTPKTGLDIFTPTNSTTPPPRTQ